MALRCDNCEKTTRAGVSQRHGRGVAGKRWKKRAQATKRTFAPNIQPASVLVEGKSVRLRLCTKCIKRFRKEGQLVNQRNTLHASL